MSYRNPQIIVDRSGEIWGQAIAGVGKDIARGLESYTAIKRKNKEISDKQIASKQLTSNVVSQNYYEGIEEGSLNIKDSAFADKFKETATMMANEGEVFNINGRSFKIGAIEAQTELKMNPNLDKDTRAAYSQSVARFKGYQQTMLKATGNLTVGLESLNEGTSGSLGTMQDFFGDGFKNTQSQIAAYSLSNKRLSGVESVKDIKRIKSADGQFKNMLHITSSVDTTSAQYKQWEEAGLISRDDLTFKEGSNIGTFSWERDLATWGEEGNLIIDIPQPPSTTEAMKDAGFLNKDSEPTSKGFNKNLVYRSRTVNGGVENSAEKHFNPDTLRNDPVYDAELKAYAASILALPGDQQSKYLDNKVGWPLINQKDWAGATMAAKTSFLMENKFEKDLPLMMASGKKGSVMKTRDATPEDVADYKKDGIDISLLNSSTIDPETGKKVPGTPTQIYYTTEKSTKILDDSTGTTQTSGLSSGEAFYNELKQNPVGLYQEYAKVAPKFNRKKNTITIYAKDTEDGEKIVYNMNNQSERNSFYLDLLEVTERSKGNSKDKQAFRKDFEDAMRLGTKEKISAKKKKSDDYFSKEADKAISNKSKGDNIFKQG